jgi:hypothetical protein
VMRPGIFALLPYFALGGAGGAMAARRPADLTGWWDLYLVAAVAGGNSSGLAWLACDVRFGSAGGINSGSRCIDSAGNRVAVGGRLATKSSCRASGFLVRSGRSRFRVTIPQVTLSRDRAALTGVAVINNISINMVTPINMVLHAVRR